MTNTQQSLKPLEVVPVHPPPPSQVACRGAVPAAPGEKRTRYTLPAGLESPSPVGYRVRISLTEAEATEAMTLLSLQRPTGFVAAAPATEQELFEECSLGVLSSRQSTNFQGLRQVTFGPEHSEEIYGLLSEMSEVEAPPLPGASHTHVVLSRPYRTPFTLLLTLVGHKPVLNLLTVPWRMFRKRFFHDDDIPTIGFLQHLHLGVLAECMERAAVLASGGRRKALVLGAPFAGRAREPNRGSINELGKLCGLTPGQMAKGWRVGLVAQVGVVEEGDRVDLAPGLCRKLGANLISFRSERIQPGVNAEDTAPEVYQHRQDMDVSPELVLQAGRAAYNAFSHWVGCEREQAKDLLLMDRVDVLTPGGKERLREIRKMLNDVTDRLIGRIPLWADLPTGRAFSRNASRGRKAFSLAGQRIYIAGLSRADLKAAGHDWRRAVRAVGASAARSALYVEFMGCIDIPEGADLLAGMCLMAGPVNQNDVGKQFYGVPDLLAMGGRHRDPTSMLVWTLKAKTVADPLGNEEQLMNTRRKGALVDLRPGPHQVVLLSQGGGLRPMRSEGGRFNNERAFGDQGNFATAPDGSPIPGNAGTSWGSPVGV